MQDSTSKVAVITGASHGLGASLAQLFKRNGYTVTAVSRREPPEGAADHFIAADLLDAADRTRVIETLKELHPEGIDVLINNAGIGSYATWEALAPEDLRKLFEIDFFAPAEMTPQLAGLLALKKGCVVNVASMAAHIPVGCMGAYCAVKAAIRMFSETLRMEFRGRGIHVLTVCPGRIDTGFSQRAVGDRKPPETPGRTSSSAAAFAERTFRAVQKRKRELIYPGWYALVAAFVRHFPAVNERANRKIWQLKDEN